MNALRAGAKDLAKGAAGAAGQRRTDSDLSLKWALIGSGVLLLIMWAMLTFLPITGRRDASVLNNFLAALLVVVFGFLFVRFHRALRD